MLQSDIHNDGLSYTISIGHGAVSLITDKSEAKCKLACYFNPRNLVREIEDESFRDGLWVLWPDSPRSYVRVVVSRYDIPPLAQGRTHMYISNTQTRID